MNKEEAKTRILEIESQKNEIQKRMNEIVNKGTENKLDDDNKNEIKLLSKQMEVVDKEMMRLASQFSLTELMDFASSFGND